MNRILQEMRKTPIFWLLVLAPAVLVAEHLASEDGLTIDHETLRRWMLAAGLWSRRRKRSPHRHRPRRRR